MKPIAEIDKAIKSITASGAKLDKLIQDTAVNVAEHYAQHKDTGLVNRLFLAMPKGSRRNALADWLLKFVAVGVNTGATKKEQPFIHDREKATDALGGAKVMWYDLKPEKAVDEVFDVATAFKAILRRIEKSTKVEHFDRPALVAFAKSVGIPESDVPTKAALDPLAEEAPM
jgi:hypothetical protein